MLGSNFCGHKLTTTHEYVAMCPSMISCFETSHMVFATLSKMTSNTWVRCMDSLESNYAQLGFMLGYLIGYLYSVDYPVFEFF